MLCVTLCSRSQILLAKLTALVNLQGAIIKVVMCADVVLKNSCVLVENYKYQSCFAKYIYVHMKCE